MKFKFKLKNCIIFALIICFFTAFFSNDLRVYAEPVQERIGGRDRYETSIKISQANYINSDYLVLVNGENFPDAISAAPLAKKYNAPILLVKPTGLDSSLLNEISRLKVKNVLIIGGTGVVSNGVENQLNLLNISVKRYAGIDRFETSSKIAMEIGVANGAIIASGENFPDALSIASIAAAKQMPILLVRATLIPASIQKYISDNYISNFYVIGGKGVINDATISKLSNYKRITGENRYETNLAVLNEFSGFINLNSIFLASGQDFPDALAGAAVASLDKSPILLTSSDSNSALGYYKSNYYSVKNIKVLGGIGAVSDEVLQKFLNPSIYTRKILGYATYYYYGAQESYNSIVSNSKSLDEIATDTFATDGNGNLIAQKGYNSQGSLVDLIPVNQINYANSNNIAAYVMITNGFSADIARTLLRNSTNRQNLIKNTLDKIKAYNYSGVNVDIEGIYASDRSYFTTFIQELSVALKSRGYTVTIAVPAKTRDSLTDGWSGGYDYTEIAKCVDQVVIMTYDEHWSGGDPGSIASINWVNNVIKYAVTSIPKQKILLGLAAYGYDWGANVKTKAYSVNQAYSVAKLYGATISFDDISKSPHYNYVSGGVNHSVWFENSQSIGYKIDLVNSYDLGGVAIWSLAQTNSDYWNNINLKLNK